jgi:hypothetical protein
METYIKRLQGWRDSGQQVWIDGMCLSSCTMVLGIIPANRICVTPRAVLGFHTAWNPSPYGKHIHHKGTNQLMDIYPPIIRQWIANNGGLTPDIKYLQGRELAVMYKPCPQSSVGGQTIGTQQTIGSQRSLGGQTIGTRRSPGGQTIGTPRYFNGQTIGR